jgi:hypothetical protein
MLESGHGRTVWATTYSPRESGSRAAQTETMSWFPKELVMPAITIFATAQITIWYHPDTRIIHHQMHQYTHGKDFRDALMVGLEAMKRYRAHKWLSDDRKMPVMTPEDQQWGTEVWQPLILKAGWKYWAVVRPKHTLAAMRMEKLAEKYTMLGVTVKLFDEPDEAMRWLVSK